MKTNRSPDIYVITAVNMGDRPSGTIAIVALRKTAIKGVKEYPKAAEVVINSSYVDDIVDSVGTIEEAYKLTNDICSLLIGVFPASRSLRFTFVTKRHIKY